MAKDLTIGEAARAVGVSVDTVRFYERGGVMAAPPRNAGGRRVYGPQQMIELTFIIRARGVRMPLPEIGRYLSLARQGDKTLPERMRILSAQKQQVVAQIASMQETLRILDEKLSRATEIVARLETTGRGSHLHVVRRRDRQ
jgi:DNA-binding transcriptional MerR regulator